MPRDSPFDRQMDAFDDDLGRAEEIDIITNQTSLNDEQAGELARAADFLRADGEPVSVTMLTDVAESVDAFTQDALERELEAQGHL